MCNRVPESSPACVRTREKNSRGELLLASVRGAFIVLGCNDINCHCGEKGANSCSDWTGIFFNFLTLDPVLQRKSFWPTASTSFEPYGQRSGPGLNRAVLGLVNGWFASDRLPKAGGSRERLLRDRHAQMQPLFHNFEKLACSQYKLLLYFFKYSNTGQF